MVFQRALRNFGNAEATSDPGEELGNQLFLEDAASLGNHLREAREAAGLSIEDVHKKLYLSEQVIKALEDADINVLGRRNRVYVEGHYASYARLLKVPVENSRFEMESSLAPTSTVIASGNISAPRARWDVRFRVSDHSDAIIIGFVVLMTLVVAGIIWWVWSNVDDEIDLPATAVSNDTGDATRIDAVDDESFYILSGIDDDARTTEGTSSEDFSSNSQTPTNVDATFQENPELISDSREASTITETNESTALPSDSEIQQPVEGAESTLASPTTAGSVLLEFSDVCWVEVQDATDEMRYRDLGTAGQSVTVTGLLPFRVRIGDVSAVEVSFNGQVVDLSAHSYGNVANFTLP